MALEEEILNALKELGKKFGKEDASISVEIFKIKEERYPERKIHVTDLINGKKAIVETIEIERKEQQQEKAYDYLKSVAEQLSKKGIDYLEYPNGKKINFYFSKQEKSC
ncbi:MAG: hypothetical protein QXG83_01595 [Candidatus Pacearchaeota archaeon]